MPFLAHNRLVNALTHCNEIKQDNTIYIYIYQQNSNLFLDQKCLSTKLRLAIVNCQYASMFIQAIVYSLQPIQLCLIGIHVINQY